MLTEKLLRVLFAEWYINKINITQKRERKKFVKRKMPLRETVILSRRSEANKHSAQMDVEWSQGKNFVHIAHRLFKKSCLRMLNIIISY